MFIIGIDVGLTNLGFALLNTETKKIEIAERIALVAKKKDLKNRDHIITRVWALLFHKYKDAFEKASYILVERQLKTLFIIIENTIASICFMLKKNCIVVSPSTVKKMFGTSCNNYEQNKKAAVATATHFYPEIIMKLEGKIDDVCDAILMAVFYMYHLQGHKTIDNPSVLNIEKSARRKSTKRKATTTKKTVKRKKVK